MAQISILEDGERIPFAFEDLVRFHGTKAICGLTVSFKAMEAAWEAVWENRPPTREVLRVSSAFPGPGTRDGFEMVTRAVSRDAYEILTDVAHGPLIAEAGKGAYFFRMADDKQVIEVGLKPEVVPKEFVPRRRQLARGEASPEQAAEFRALQFAFSDSLRAMRPSEAVNVLDIRSIDA